MVSKYNRNSVREQVYEEAARAFFSCNKFSIGTGLPGARCEPNVHGLNQFIHRVPDFCLASIREIDFVAYNRNRFRREPAPINSNLNTEDSIRLVDDGVLSIISRLLRKHFVGLRTINIQIAGYGTDAMKDVLSDANMRIANSIQALMDLPNLRTISTQHCGTFIKEDCDRIVEAGLADLTVQNFSDTNCRGCYLISFKR